MDELALLRDILLSLGCLGLLFVISGGTLVCSYMLWWWLEKRYREEHYQGVEQALIAFAQSKAEELLSYGSK